MKIINYSKTLLVSFFLLLIIFGKMIKKQISDTKLEIISAIISA